MAVLGSTTRPNCRSQNLFGGVVGGDGCEVVESGEAVGGQCESGAPGFVFERPDPVSGHPDCEAGGEDGVGGRCAAGETDAEQSLEDCDRAREAGDDRSESPDQECCYGDDRGNSHAVVLLLVGDSGCAVCRRVCRVGPTGIAVSTGQNRAF